MDSFCEEISKKYRIIKQIGQGGMSKVFLAQESVSGFLCVVKKVKRKNMSDSSIYKQIKALDCPFLTKIIKIYQTEAFIYLIEEFIDGVTLHYLLNTKRSIDIATAAKWFIEICTAIFFLHKTKPYPVLHGDINPQNIMLTKNHIKIIDYSSILELTACELELKHIYGTIGYTAPEVINYKKISIPSEIYSIGATLFNVVSGTKPKIQNLEHFILSKEIRIPLSRIIYQCVRTVPQNRYESVETIIKDLKRI